MIIVRNKKTFKEEDFEGKTIVYIGRGSTFGNPYKMRNKSIDERKRVINEFKLIFYSNEGKEMRKKAKELALNHKDIVLLCWCYPDPCHGDIIKEYMELTVDGLIVDDFNPITQQISEIESILKSHGPFSSEKE